MQARRPRRPPLSRRNHSTASPTVARPTMIAKIAPPDQTQAITMGPRISADTVRRPRSAQRCARSAGSGTEATLAARIFGQRRSEMLRCEIRPQNVQKYQFGICRLPEQKIREPLLARSADHEVRIGDA